MQPDPDAARPDWFALSAGLATAALSFTPLADYGSGFIIAACLFWTTFVIVRVFQDRRALSNWGFRREHLGATLFASALVFVTGAITLAGIAWFKGTLRFPLHALFLFPVYAIWGVLQQFLTLSILTQNMQHFEMFRRNSALLVITVASIFGLMHANNLLLAVATFVLELAILPMYLRWKNLLPLGLLHGCLGGLFYLWVLDRDLWMERFG